jgi:ankyrin repeat protein
MKKKTTKRIITSSIFIVLLLVGIYFLVMFILGKIDGSAVIAAVEDGDIAEVQRLIEAGANVNATDCDERLPLETAVEKGNAQIVKMLVDNNADIYAMSGHYYYRDKNALQIAYYLGSNHIVRILGEAIATRADEGSNIKKLWQKGIIYSTDSFVERAKNNDMEIITLFVEQGMEVSNPDVQDMTALSYASANKNMNMVKVIVEDGKGLRQEDLNNSLWIAVAAGYQDIACYLIDKGADVKYADYRGTNLLAVSPVAELTRYLLEKGADVNRADDDGVTPLMAVATELKVDENIRVEIIKVLLEHGADPNASNNAGTLLSQTRNYGRREIEKLLKEAGAKEIVTWESFLNGVQRNDLTTVKYMLDDGIYINAQNNQGETALIIAARNGYVDMVKLLVRHKIDINIKDNNNKTALDVARENGRNSIALLLSTTQTITQKNLVKKVKIYGVIV